MNETSPIPRHVLEQVHHDNIRNHQIGGVFDGITPEVAADLGFTEFREAASSEDVDALRRDFIAPTSGPLVEGPLPSRPPRLEDPELDEEWQRQRNAAPNLGRVAAEDLTDSKKKNKNGRKAESAHYRRATGPGGWRQVRHPRSHS